MYIFKSNDRESIVAPDDGMICWNIYWVRWLFCLRYLTFWILDFYHYNVSPRAYAKILRSVHFYGTSRSEPEIPNQVDTERLSVLTRFSWPRRSFDEGICFDLEELSPPRQESLHLQLTPFESPLPQESV
jgi:hypothetical protein